jgi:hypothetical protein
MGKAVVTAIDVKVDPSREAELLDGFRQLSEGGWPDALVRTELLRGRDGTWRVQSTWRDLEAVIAMRQSGARPAALDLLDRLGLEHSHGVFTVEQAYTPR